MDLIKRVKDEANLIQNEIIKKKRDFNQTTMNGFSKIQTTDHRQSCKSQLGFVQESPSPIVKGVSSFLKNGVTPQKFIMTTQYPVNQSQAAYAFGNNVTGGPYASNFPTPRTSYQE